MEVTNALGTTVTVGSVSELATILANMPPEQLENVQLDPILYNALFQTLDSNPQILDGNDQTVNQPTTQPVTQEVQTKNIVPQVKAQSIVPQVKAQPIVPQVKAQPIVQNLPNVTLQQAAPVSNNVVLSSRKISDNAKKASTTISSQQFASKKPVIPTKSFTSHTKTAVQPIQLIRKPIASTKSSKTPPQVVKNVKNNVSAVSLPMMVVTTVDSHILPTVSTQSIKANNNVLSTEYTQVVTLPSNAYLQPTIVQSMNGEKSLNHATPIDFKVQQSEEAPVLVNENVIVSHTVEASHVPSQITDMEAATFLKKNPGSVSTTANLDIFSIPINTNNVQTLENDICVDNTSAIVLTAEQLTEIMSGKTLEEVLQGTISEQGLESVLVADPSISASFNEISNVNVMPPSIIPLTNHMPPLRPTPTRVIDRKLCTTQPNVSSQVSIKLPQKSNQTPTNRPQVCERTKIQTLKPTAHLAEVKKNVFSASSSTPTKSFTAVSTASKDQKNVVINNSNKPSAFTPYKQTPNILNKDDKKISPKQNTTNQSTNNINQKHTIETMSNSQSKVDHKSIFKSPVKKIFSSEKLNQPQEVNKQAKVVTSSNVMKSVVVVNKVESKTQKTNITTSDAEREKIEIMKSGKATFNRSFKKTSPNGDSKKKFKKTLKEMGKTYPNEVNEILSIREAIKSSHVGDGESAMRQLAKMEIENQLKRFSQKVNSTKPEKSPEKRIDYRRRRKYSDNDKSHRNNKNVDESESDRKTDSSNLSKDGGRKRERPKKFDDFVLNSKPKKDKKLKSRKFFFPGDPTIDDKNVLKSIEVEKEVLVAKEKTITTKETNEKIIDQKPISEKPISEKIIVEKPISEKPISEKPISNALTKLKSPKKVEKNTLPEKEKLPEKALGSEKNSKKDGKQKTVEDLLRSKILEYDTQLEKAKKKPVVPKTIKKNEAENVVKTTIDLTCSESAASPETPIVKPKAGESAPLVTPTGKPKVGEERSFLDAMDSNKTADVEPKKEDEDMEQANEDTQDDDESEDEKENVADNKSVKEGNKSTTKKKKKKKKKPAIAFEPEVLPEHLKKKPKIAVEDVVVDLSKVQLKSSCIETSFELNDSVELKTVELLKRNSWVCTFCGKPGNIGNLDVLFGPYSVKISDSDNDCKNMKVWMHRDCAIWTSSICLSNQTLCGLGDALTTAANMVGFMAFRA